MLTIPAEQFNSECLLLLKMMDLFSYLALICTCKRSSLSQNVARTFGIRLKTKAGLDEKINNLGENREATSFTGIKRKLIALDLVALIGALAFH